MTLHTPLAMQPGSGDPDITYTAQEWRQFLNGLMAAGAVPLDREGILGPAALKVTQRGAGANFSVDIAAGQALVSGGDITAQGPYWIWNDATFNLATPGAPGSGTRTHRVVAQIRDKLSNGSYTTYDWVPLLLQDTGTGEPPEPASALTLAHVSIATGQANVSNANIADARYPAGAVAAFKAADQTVTSSTAKVDDTALQIALGPNATYEFRAMITYTAPQAGDIAVVFAGPAGASAALGFSALDAAATTNTNTALTSRATALPTATVTFGGNDTQVLPLFVIGTVTTSATPGIFKLQWAQGTSNATGTVVKAGSYFAANRIG
jgi:peptidoglycan hydrolase-like protein with peptidoglycan-binding domain